MSKLRYFSLHGHSAYSQLDGHGFPERIAERCKELGQAGAALTDHGTCIGHAHHWRALTKAGLKPVLGNEMYLVGDMRDRGGNKNADRRQGERRAARYSHVTVLARNQEGYRNLLKLTTLSYEEGFYYKPRVDPATLARHSSGLIVLSGCVIGHASQLILNDREDDALRWLTWYRNNLESFLCELVPCPDLEISQQALPVLYRMARELKIPLIASDDAHFVLPGDHAAQDCMLAINTGRKVNDPERELRLPEYHYRPSGEEVLERLRWCLPTVAEEELQEIVERSATIAEACDAELPKTTGPKFTVPTGVTAEELLRKLAHEGLKRRWEGPCNLSTACSTNSFSGNLEPYRPDAGNGVGTQLPEGMEKPDTTGERNWSTGSCMNTSSDLSLTAMNSITGARTPAAPTSSTWSPSPPRSTVGSATASPESTPERPSASTDTPSRAQTSSFTRMEDESAESAGERPSASGASITSNVNGNDWQNTESETERRSERTAVSTCASIAPLREQREVYRQRLEHELDVLCRCGLANYILVTNDLVQELHRREILVVPRGSAGGSLVLWALGITVVDPIQHGLSFARFCDEAKRDLDIDLDVAHSRRSEAFEYLQTKYGSENCAHVATLSTFGARQALLDVGKTCEIPDAAISALAALVPEAEAEGEDKGLHDTEVLQRLFDRNEKAQKIAEEWPQVLLAVQLEGQVRQTSIHAGGFLVDSRPIHETVALMSRPGKERVAAISKDFAAEVGLLKMDVLGSKTLTAIAETLQELGLPLSTLYELPLEDADVFAMLAEGRNLGVFQLQGTAAGRIMRKLCPATFEEFTAVSALARPGPLKSGSVQRFVGRKLGTVAEAALHPLLGDVLKSTRGEVLFQEQPMELGATAGFAVEDVQKIRKLISKIGGAEAVDVYKDAFWAGCLERGVPEDQIALVWEQCKEAGAYLFCKAHAVQYASTGMWTGHLKVRAPSVFTAALCRNIGNLDPEERQFALLREFVERGGVVRLLDLERSGLDFQATNEWEIVGGYQSLKGCGPKTAPKVVAKAPFATWEDLCAALGRRVGLPLAASGIAEGRLNADVLQGLCPWYPLRPLTDEELLERGKAGIATIADTKLAVAQGYRADVMFLGRVTRVVETDLVAQAKKYGSEPPAPGEPGTRTLFTITDETGSVDLYFSAKCWRQCLHLGLTEGPGKGLGNTVAIEAWWNEELERFYARRAVTVRIWEPFVVPPSSKGGCEEAE